MNTCISPTPADAPEPAFSYPTLTNIIATIGPASESPEVVRALIRAGVSVFRLNFSHGQLEEHAVRLGVIREAARELDHPIGVLGDLQGPKIRLGKLPSDGFTVDVGQDVVLVPPDDPRANTRRDDALHVASGYERLAHDVRDGDRVLINDGAVRLLAVPRELVDGSGDLRCRVLAGGLLSSHKGINLPDTDVSESAITTRDWACVEWAVAHGLDFLALSFVRNAAEVRQLKAALAGMCPVDFAVEKTGAGAMIPVVAKIEKPQAVADIDAIAQAADALMVARGDLGVEMDLAEVPIVQKRLIAKADEWGKPCIVATQMLESMITGATPTRAEATDVAGAVFDHADAVMLSGETAVGKHPVLVVETMRRILVAAEGVVREQQTAPTPPRRLVESRYRTVALAHGAWYVARDIGAKLVVCWSQRGGTARYLSQTGLRLPIVAYSSDEREVRRMAMLRGVTARHAAVPTSGSLSEWNHQIERDLLARGWVRPGDPIVILAGKPLGEHAATNTLAVHYIGNHALGYMRH